jgi:hypothetical protein
VCTFNSYSFDHPSFFRVVRRWEDGGGCLHGGHMEAFVGFGVWAHFDLQRSRMGDAVDFEGGGLSSMSDGLHVVNIPLNGRHIQ